MIVLNCIDQNEKAEPDLIDSPEAANRTNDITKYLTNSSKNFIIFITLISYYSLLRNSSFYYNTKYILHV